VMLQAGKPAISLAVYDELIARSENPQSKDFDLLSGKTRENLLFRAGHAALEAGEYVKAIQHLSRLIDENPRNPHLFKARLYLAKAKAAKTPPDMAGALNELADVRSNAPDEALVNEALITLAQVFLQDDSEKGVRRALGQAQQIVLIVDGEPTLLADESAAENQPFIEEALYIAAKCYALLGMDQEKTMMTEMYRKRFPKGRFAAEMNSLPAAKYRNPAAVPAAANTAS